MSLTLSAVGVVLIHIDKETVLQQRPSFFFFYKRRTLDHEFKWLSKHFFPFLDSTPLVKKKNASWKGQKVTKVMTWKTMEGGSHWFVSPIH